MPMLDLFNFVSKHAKLCMCGKHKGINYKVEAKPIKRLFSSLVKVHVENN